MTKKPLDVRYMKNKRKKQNKTKNKTNKQHDMIRYLHTIEEAYLHIGTHLSTCKYLMGNDAESLQGTLDNFI